MKSETREGVKPQGCKIKVRAVRLCYSLVGHLCSWMVSGLPVCQQIPAVLLSHHTAREQLSDNTKVSFPDECESLELRTSNLQLSSKVTSKGVVVWGAVCN